jgi:beta-phosphoglucomutase
MMIKACLFDLDGVLVDTARFHYLAWKLLADGLGFEFTETDNERLKGISRMDSLDILLDIGNIELPAEDKTRIANEKNKVYLSYVEQMTPGDVLPGVSNFLKELKDTGILTGLGSASKNARLILQKTGLDSMFNVIVDGNMVTQAKPHPEVFALGAHLLEVEPNDCLVFEDAVAGIQAAHNAGMKCVGIGSPQTLKKADLVLPGFMNLKMVDLVFS